MAAKPVSSGTIAAPTIAVVIRPEISLVFSGIRSTQIEKIKGKILAKPTPIRMKLSQVVTALYGRNNNTLPIMETITVRIKKTVGLI